MELNEIKSRVYAKNKNMDWLINKFGTAKSYFYREVRAGNEKVISRINEILDKE